MTKKYNEFINYINTFFSVFQNITADSKKEWIQILKEYKFDDAYEITTVPTILNQFGINGTVALSLTNFAYIASRHIHEYEIDVYLKMKEVIEEYDLLLHGEQKGNRDFRFYKLYVTEDDKIYGIELLIDKKDTFRNEYIVHLNYIGKHKNKALKLYRKYMKSKNLIDFKK